MDSGNEDRRVLLTVAASTGEPSWNRTPGLSLIFSVRSSALVDQLSASHGDSRPSLVTVRSASVVRNCRNR